MADRSRFQWYPTSAPPMGSKYGRYDDVFFIDPDTGWCVGSDGRALKTTDGGVCWTPVFTLPPHSKLYLRTVGFASRDLGWIGALNVSVGSDDAEDGPEPAILFKTEDGGSTWKPVPLPPRSLSGVCGLWAVDESTVYLSGTMDPTRPARVLSTLDGGKRWQVFDMSAHADNLIDAYFRDAQEGWVVGGKAGKVRATCPPYQQPENQSDADLVPVVLHTANGGRDWDNRVCDLEFPPGEWGWKIQFVNPRLGFVSLENLCGAAILKTVDGGRKWKRLPVEGNNDLEGVGFVDEAVGWVGGWGFHDRDPTGTSSGTTDGGLDWSPAAIDQRINRFQFLGDPVAVGYSSGRRIWKYSAAAPPLAPLAEPRPGMIRSVRALDDGRVVFDYHLPSARYAGLIVWTHHGRRVAVLVDEDDPQSGPRSSEWDGADKSGVRLGPGAYVYRLTADDRVESGVVVKPS